MSDLKPSYMGYMCSYVPVEIIWSAGYIPFRLTGNADNVSGAYAYLPSTCCSLVSGTLERMLQGEFDFLSGLIIPQTCDRMREIFDVFRITAQLHFNHQLIAPMHTDTIYAQQFYCQELKMLIERLSLLIGREISTEQLNMAINKYNTVRSLLRKLSDARALSVITGLDYYKMVMDFSVTHPDQAILALEGMLKSLPEKRTDLEGRVRLLVSGSVVENLEHIALLENNGALIVCDDLCLGSRGDVGNIHSYSEDPVKDLAQKYLGKIKCPCKYPSQNRWQEILASAKASRVDGIVLMLKKFCDCHWIEQPELERTLRTAGYPVLVLGIENETGIESLRTRVHAFIEILSREKFGGCSL